MLASELIRTSKEVMLCRGWNQGGFEARDGSGAVCMAGALNVALTGSAYGLLSSNGPITSMKAQRAVASACNRALSGESIPHFNDLTAKHVDDVLDAFDRAEKYALIAEEAIV